MNKKLDEGERQEILANPELIQEKFTEKLTGTAHVKLQNAFRDIEERHRDLLKLERVSLI